MEARYQIVGDSKKGYQSVNPDAYIERLKKLRSLNVDLSRFGTETYQLKKMFFGTFNILKKW